jgi:hypothetical protein
MPSIALQPATTPGDAVFPPANWAVLLNYVSSYLRVSGLENLTGVVVSATTPAAADNDKLWLKRDPSTTRPLGILAFTSGVWQALPVSLPSGEDEPAGAKAGELFFNTKLGAVRLYNGSLWTTNLWQSGNIAARPESAATNYIYLDTEIGRLIRWNGSLWTTVDGGVGDVKMVDYATVEDALKFNPGWEEFTPMAGRFPIAASESGLAPQAEGGQQLEELNIKWSAKGRSAEGGARQPDASFLAELSINGQSARADGTRMAGLTDIGSEKTIKLTPPYKALIFLRKAA